MTEPKVPLLEGGVSPKNTPPGKCNNPSVGNRLLVIVLLFMFATPVLVATPCAADGVSHVIYPPNKTSVDLATITIFGVVPDKKHIPRITLNRGGIIASIESNGVFVQSLLLKRGVNVLKVDGARYFISYDALGKKPREGYVRRSLHPPAQESCANCHDFTIEGGSSLLADGNELCLECHNDPSSKMKFPHKALEKGCISCHDPHLWEEGRPNKVAVPGLCYDCHDKKTGGKYAHKPFENNECGACHGVHGGNSPGLMISGRDEVCFTCHDDPTQSMKTVHPALEKGCAFCHDPHSSDSPRLLNKGNNETCFGCHDDPSKGKKVTHAALDKGCTSCHNPHASYNPFLLAGEQATICEECHSEIIPQGADINDHSPIAQSGDCSGCHDPHGADENKLLTAKVPGLCYECHDDITGGSGKGGTVHSPVKEGSCTDCHNPHGGPAALLISRDVCYKCHDPYVAPQKGSIHDPVESGDCGQCHDAHASPEKGMLVNPETELCFRCHNKFQGPVVHPPVESEKSCSSCHDPHVGKAPALLAHEGMELCIQCHDNPANPFHPDNKVLHSPIDDDRKCTPCHSPHAGEKKMLIKLEPELCYTCHDDVTVKKNGKEYEFVHGPVNFGGCTGCHGAHAARQKYLLAAKGSHVCLACHEDPAVDKNGNAWVSSHAPVKENCAHCHTPHGSDYKEQLKDDIYTLCSGCHLAHPNHILDGEIAISGRSTMVRLPPDFPVTRGGQLVCTGCHLPHGADFKPLFEKKRMDICAKCHG